MFEDWETFKKELLKDPEVKKAYDELAPEYELIKAIIGKRIELNLTQAQLAKKIGSKQSAISRLESGQSNPSFKFLQKIAKALDSDLLISLK